MSKRRIKVTRTRHRLLPDRRRLVTRPFLLSQELLPDGRSRVKLAMERILAMPDGEVSSTLREVLADFSSRHRDLELAFEQNFLLSAHHLDDGTGLSREHRLLIGAYFTREFSIEAAALFSPSIVPAPDQTGLTPGEQRFIMSVRGVGEGHISSISFRKGVIDAAGGISLEEPSAYASTGLRTTPVYDRNLFAAKLTELGANNEVASPVLYQLSRNFTFEELERSITSFNETCPYPTIAYETIRIIHMLASSNYLVSFPPESDISERVIFPAGPNESRGMEDARFVRFVHGDGSVTYYATYTAFDGFQILPQLIETKDFVSFRIATLTGACAQNKGMALFPRLIDGRYAVVSRNDNESLYTMTSDNVRRWSSADKLRAPTEPWELLQIGNCGSPIETEAGWLVLTHGVGPVRRYTIGAMLLDLEDPRRVIASLCDSLVEPQARERDGYVPNVVYSCGGMVHDDHLVLPYGFSDYGIGIAIVPLKELLARLLEHGCDG
ncbi:MAG: glycoside hydrolase family 130 protein [Planctomycetota bacterium]